MDEDTLIAGTIVSVVLIIFCFIAFCVDRNFAQERYMADKGYCYQNNGGNVWHYQKCR